MVNSFIYLCCFFNWGNGSRVKNNKIKYINQSKKITENKLCLKKVHVEVLFMYFGRGASQGIRLVPILGSQGFWDSGSLTWISHSWLYARILTWLYIWCWCREVCTRWQTYTLAIVHTGKRTQVLNTECNWTAVRWIVQLLGMACVPAIWALDWLPSETCEGSIKRNEAAWTLEEWERRRNDK